MAKLKPMKIYETFGVRLNPLHTKLTEYPMLDKLGASAVLAGYPKRDVDSLLNYGVGIEVEAENAVALNSDFWQIAGDNSLRNGGVEFKTTYGIRIGHLPEALLQLEGHAKRHKLDFSERTSVHVHLDCRMLTSEEVRQVFVLYLLFEKALFRYAGIDRSHNVFCVPFGQSHKCTTTTNFTRFIQNAEKYNAINLLTLTQFGTIEFRNMRGSADANFIFNWVMLLAHLRHFATHIPYDKFEEMVFSLKTTSMFNHLRNQVFRGFSNLVTVESKEVDDAVTTAKLFF